MIASLIYQWGLTPVIGLYGLVFVQTKAFQEALDDVKHGRVTHYNSVDDMFRSVLGEEAFSKLRRSNI